MTNAFGFLYVFSFFLYPRQVRSQYMHVLVMHAMQVNHGCIVGTIAGWVKHRHMHSHFNKYSNAFLIMKYFSWLFSLNFTRFPVGFLRKHSRTWWINLIHAFWTYISFFVSFSVWSSSWVLGQHPDQGPSCSVARFGKTSNSWKCLNGSNLLPFHESLCQCASG